jgi:hypothetical protein
VKLLGLGLGLTVVVTAVLWRLFGAAALLPAASFGLLATAIQWVAVRALVRSFHGTTTEFYRGFGTGLVLRTGGVLLLLAAVLIDAERFPPLPTAFGYLGVVIPLLFLEVRFVR